MTSAPRDVLTAAGTPSSELRARLLRAKEVLVALTLAELRQERDLSLSGILKWVLEPLSYMLVYFILVVTILNRTRQAYMLFLLAALIPFRYFTGVVGRSMFVINKYSSTITNRAFPRVVLPLVGVLTDGLSLLIALPLLAPMMAVYGVPPRPSLLWIPVVLAVLAVLTSGAAYIAAVFGLYFPDYRGSVQNLLRILFFASTGLVKARGIPGEELPILLQANPLSGVFDAMRAAVMSGRTPDLIDLLYPLAFGLGLLTVGLSLYRSREHQFAKEV